MLSEVLMIITLISIWLSILMSMITLGGATHFWLKQSKVLVDVKPLKKYPKISIIVPAHNEELVIA
ncbi:glycosyltransferase family 2 protein, partial [Streptococcus anginosus]|nr:glycosyltransferase family 2 protein [Streptococcus anginosus]